MKNISIARKEKKRGKGKKEKRNVETKLRLLGCQGNPDKIRFV
jgi:hypothetical protein